MVDTVNIEEDAVLQERYGDVIPVVAVNGEPLFFGKVSELRLREILAGRTVSPRYRTFLQRLPALLRNLRRRR